MKSIIEKLYGDLIACFLAAYVSLVNDNLPFSGGYNSILQ
jgi:hypothetical protein